MPILLLLMLLRRLLGIGSRVRLRHVPQKAQEGRHLLRLHSGPREGDRLLAHDHYVYRAHLHEDFLLRARLGRVLQLVPRRSRLRLRTLLVHQADPRGLHVHA